MQNCEKAKSQWKRRYVSKVMFFWCFCYTVLLTNLKIGLSLSKSLFEVVKEPKWAPQRASLTTSLRHFHFVISPLWENHTKKPPFLYIYAETGADVFYSLMNGFISLLDGTVLFWNDYCFSFEWDLHDQKFTPMLSVRQPLWEESNSSWQMFARPMS